MSKWEKRMRWEILCGCSSGDVWLTLIYRNIVCISFNDRVRSFGKRGITPPKPLYLPHSYKQQGVVLIVPIFPFALAIFQHSRLFAHGDAQQPVVYATVLHIGWYISTLLCTVIWPFHVDWYVAQNCDKHLSSRTPSRGIMWLRINYRRDLTNIFQDAFSEWKL